MLVLSRKLGETIVIETPEGKLIQVVLVQIKGKQTRIGIKCDKDVKVDRAEALLDEESQYARATSYTK